MSYQIINSQKIMKLIRHPISGFPKMVLKIFGIPLSIWIVNFLFQRVFRLNSDVPYSVHFTSRIGSAKKIEIGKNVWKSFALSGNCYIQGGNGIIIGDDSIFAPGVKIISANHDLLNLSRWVKAPPVRIGKRCWIGANAVILPSVELGDGVIVGAGAVVTRSFPSGATVVGNPARQIPKKNQ